MDLDFFDEEVEEEQEEDDPADKEFLANLDKLTAIVFPIKQQAVHHSLKYDRTNFSSSERAALRNAWRIIKRDYRKHTLNITFSFLTEHEYLINRFRNSAGTLCLYDLYIHTKALVRVYDQLIRDALGFPQTVNIIMRIIGHKHRVWKVPQEEIMMLTKHLTDHVLDTVGAIKTPLLIAAFEKLNALIASFHEWTEEDSYFEFDKM